MATERTCTARPAAGTAASAVAAGFAVFTAGEQPAAIALTVAMAAAAAGAAALARRAAHAAAGRRATCEAGCSRTSAL